MIHDQNKSFCQCSYCNQGKIQKGISSDSITLPSSSVCSKDLMYLRTLNDALRRRSLTASAKNAHKFEPDEILESTRGEMVKSALMVPVRRRDHLQELLILENKKRLAAQRELRHSRYLAGITGQDDDDVYLLDSMVDTSDKFPDASLVGHTGDVKIDDVRKSVSPRC